MILKTRDKKEKKELDLVVFSKNHLFPNEIQNVCTVDAFGHPLY